MTPEQEVEYVTLLATEAKTHLPPYLWPQVMAGRWTAPGDAWLDFVGPAWLDTLKAAGRLLVDRRRIPPRPGQVARDVTFLVIDVDMDCLQAYPELGLRLAILWHKTGIRPVVPRDIRPSDFQ